MSVLVNNILNKIYHEDKDVTDSEFAQLILNNTLDEYIEESVSIFLKKLKDISCLQEEKHKLLPALELVNYLGRSVKYFPSDSVCFAVYLICMAEKNEWMANFLSSVALKSGDKAYFLHYVEDVND